MFIIIKYNGIIFMINDYMHLQPVKGAPMYNEIKKESSDIIDK